MAKTTLDLTGQWLFKEFPTSARRMRDLDSADWLPTNVPCSIFNSLIEAGRINRSDIDAYPEKFSEISEKSWVYKKVFDAPAELLNCDRTDLVFEGLDTITNIWLNDKLIARTNNMFIEYRFDVTQLLKPKNNSLIIRFEPATQYAKTLMKRYTTFSESDFRSPYRVYIRKAQYQFSWDWCPAMPGCGIWRPVWLEGITKARIADLHIRTIDCNNKYADVKIAVTLDTITKDDFVCRLTLDDGDKVTGHNLPYSRGEDFQSTLIRIDKPLLWWPAEYGEQHLYKLDVQLLNKDEIIDRKQTKFGIRTVKLNRSPDKFGQKFQFEINSQPVYVKGANWIPASLLAGSVTNDDYEKLLYAAQKANINMLRVWGGGYYEAKKFYELCDRLGIMVWQDFMFACGYYPDRQWFLKQVQDETTQIIKQLRNHSALVLWCGNNENDWLHGIGKFGKNKKFYGKAIYHKLLPQLVTELDPDRDYIPTTPFSDSKDANDPDSGTVHRWDIWWGYQPVRDYLCAPQDVPRFVTEFGIQSYPDMKTLRSFCPSEHLRIGSELVEKHNYQLDGNCRLYRYIGDLFGIIGGLERFVYLSQITQARAVKSYVEHLRAHNFRNSGVMFWQFNDCCPAITWSAIDGNSEPKALYYYAARFFSNVLVAVVPEVEKVSYDLPPLVRTLSVVVINDGNQPLTATLNCRLIDLFGQPVDQLSYPVSIAPFTSSAPLKLPKALTSPDNPNSTALHLLLKNGKRKIAENLFFYLPDKYINWPEVEIDKQLRQTTDNQWKLRLKSNAVAKDVQISTPVRAQLSDNFIDLIPPDEREITIDCRQNIASLAETLQLRSVRHALI